MRARGQKTEECDRGYVDEIDICGFAIVSVLQMLYYFVSQIFIWRNVNPDLTSFVHKTRTR